MKCIVDYSKRFFQKATLSELALYKIAVILVGVMLGITIPRSAKKPTFLMSLLLMMGCTIPIGISFLSGLKVSWDE